MGKSSVFLCLSILLAACSHATVSSDNSNESSASETATDPEISGSVGDGALIDGQNLTIQGSGFGTKDPVEPLLFDRVSNQTAYGELDDGDINGIVPTGEGFYWTNNGNATDGNDGNVRFYKGSESRVPGTWMYKCLESNDNGKCYFRGPDSGLPFDSDFYISFWHKVDSTTPATNASTKMIRVWPDGSGTNGRLSWTFTQWMIYNEYQDGCLPHSNPSPWIQQSLPPDTSNFHHLELLFTFDQEDECGHTYQNTIWINRTPITATASAFPDMLWGPGRKGLSIGGTYDKIERIGLDVNAPANIDPTNTWFGDIYVDQTRARVLIGDAPQFDDVVHFELQEPHTTWNDNEVMIKVNQGSFGAGEAWIYVVNANGGVNSDGISISF